MARIENHDLTVLIDSESTHNFISERIVNWLQLPVIPTKPFNVKVANGNPLKCQGRFENIQVLLQGIPFFLTLYALALCGLNLVLGVQWLEQLGVVACDWKKMTIEFRWNNQIQKLQGIDAQHIQSASLKDVSKELRQGYSMFAICLQTEAELLVNRVKSEMQQLLKDFKDIFQAPEQLPPVREIDHTITLKEGTEPVNVRPYRYAYF